jgi:acyl carrier protein
MSHDDVHAGIAEALAAVAGIDPADAAPGAAFADLGLDSMTMLAVVVAVEDRFGLLVPDDAWPRFRTVDDLARHVEQAGRLAG